MNDPLIARFADACGAAAPLNLRVGLADGRVLADGTLHEPFTLLGRDEACDVTLNDPDVHPRHAWLQVIDGRVFALDLGSRAGVVWPDGSSGLGWVEPGAALKVGPFRVTLCNPVSAAPRRPDYVPTHADPDIARTRPSVQLEFRNGRRPKDRWTVNRVLTLVGRADACKLHLSADDVAAYHCGLVLTPAGLWVVDLSGRGVVVNGERMRVAPLPDGAELWVGRFLIACRAPAATDTPPALRTSPARPAPVTPRQNGHPAPRTPPAPTVDDEDEVPLGGLPALDPMSGLPSSHILHGTFHRPTPSGPISAPILLAVGPGSGVTPAGKSSGRLGAPVPVAAEPAPVHPVAALIGQLAEIHGQMAEQVQQALLLVARVCAHPRAAGPAAVEAEVVRIKELNGELARLQGEVTRLALAHAATPTGDTAVHELTGTGYRTPRTPDAGDAIQDWVQERIGLLHRERQARWDKLVGLVSSPAESG